jgi:hypothetical protein
MINGPVQAERFRRRLIDAFGRYGRVGEDPEVQADFARYLCVLTSAYVEQVLYVLLRELTRKRSDKRVLAFVDHHLERFQNPKAEKIAELLGRFDRSWKEQFDQFVHDEPRMALNSVVATRHQIAHGESVNVTYYRLVEWRDRVFEIVDWMVQRLTS